GKSSADIASKGELPEAPSVVEMAAPARPAMENPPSNVYNNGVVPEETAEDEVGAIVRVKRFNVKPMFPEEAIEQMELLGHSFFVFWNAGDERMCVLYRRNDGDYGLLEPELT